MEILKGGYHPQRYEDIELEQLIARRYIVDLAEGRANVPVKITSAPHGRLD